MHQPSVARIRHWLYAPADSPRKLDKAMGSAADAVIADLEDAVAPDAKAAARASLSTWLEERSGSDHEPSLWVRINPATMLEDLAVACHVGVAGICLPKAESVHSVQRLDAALDDLLPRADDRTRDVSLMLLIETARGVLECNRLARSSRRLAVLQLGELDLRADLGLPPMHLSAPGVVPGPIQAARSVIVLASAAAGLHAPIAAVSPDIHDPVLAADTASLRAHGFGSRAVIHPAQLDAVAAGFAPSDDELSWANQVIAASQEAAADGTGVAVVDGRMVDAPVIAQAATILGRDRSRA